MIHQIVNVWCIVVLTDQEQTHYVNFWKRSSVTLILIFNFTTHNGKLQTELPCPCNCHINLWRIQRHFDISNKCYNKHLFLAKCQANFLRAKKESLKANEVIVLGDFAENYQFLVQDEIQSYHWSKEYCTLHPLVVYFIDGDGNIQHNSFLFHLWW